MAIKSIILAAGLAALANAYTPPGKNDYGSLLLPDLTHPVTQGKPFTVTWQQPSGAPYGQTVSLVLCNGPSTNCVPQKSAIAENVPAAQQSYVWNVPCDLPVGVQATSTGYGMLIIVDGAGDFQYSTQFSVDAGSCGSSGSSSTTSSSSSSTTGPAGTNSSSSTTAPYGQPTSSSTWAAWNSTSPMTTTTASAPASFTFATVAPTTSVAYTAPSSSATATPTAFKGAGVHNAVSVAGVLGAVALAMFGL